MELRLHRRCGGPLTEGGVCLEGGQLCVGGLAIHCHVMVIT